MTCVKKSTSTNAANEEYIRHTCPMQYALAQIAGRWKILLLWYIHLGANRFSLLKKRVPATGKMLSQQLKELESSGLLIKTSYADVPPRIEYALTDKAQALLPVLQALNVWGKQEMAKQDNETAGNDCAEQKTELRQ